MGANKNQTELNYIEEYAQKIASEDVVVGTWIKKIYDYLLKGFADGLFFYDADKANDAIDWIEAHSFHTEGPLAPGSLKLELWQKAIVASIFGIMNDKGQRQFREIVLIVARKNGKSLFASAIGKYVWLKEGGYGARVFCLAPKLDQADIIYNDTWQMVQLDPEWQALKKKIEDSRANRTRGMDDSELARHTMSDLRVPATNSTFKKIAFSAKKSDGFNPSLCICDEIASWSGDAGLKQYEVMKSGMGARPEALLLSCSTSGYENDGIYDELIKRATAFLNDESKETRLLPFLYMVDDPEQWASMDELAKSNPNLGVSVTEDYLKEEIAVAEGSLSKKAEFLTKYCNVKQNSSLAWLDAIDIAKNFADPIDLDEFKGCYCVGGIDLSQTTDLTTCLVVIEKDEKLYVFGKAFLPSERIEDATARDGIPYNRFISEGILQPSGDNFVDYKDCFNWFRGLVEEYKILPLKVGYDRYSATYLVQDMEQYGFHMDDVFQGFNLTPVIRETEGLIRDGKFSFGSNDLLKAHLLDSAIKNDIENNKCKLVKITGNAHIDFTAALLDAMCVRQKWYDEIGAQLKN